MLGLSAAELEEAVRDEDLVVIMTTSSATAVELPWLKPDAVIAHMGSYREFTLNLLLETGKLLIKPVGARQLSCLGNS